MKLNSQTSFSLLRISMGWILLWAFLDKLFGLGYATPTQSAWINGGSPTFGFLSNAPYGPFADILSSLAGNPVVDFLFMLGLLGIGFGFVFGIALRFSALCGSLLMILLWSATLPPENNPVIDKHIVYGLVMLSIAFSKKGRKWSIREAFDLPLKDNFWLR